MFNKEEGLKLKEALLATELDNVRVSILDENYEEASIYLLLMFEPKETWANGYLENSNYAHFNIYKSDMKLSYFSGTGCPKFRKTKIKNFDHLVEKLSAVIKEYYENKKNVNCVCGHKKHLAECQECFDDISKRRCFK